MGSMLSVGSVLGWTEATTISVSVRFLDGLAKPKVAGPYMISEGRGYGDMEILEEWFQRYGRQALCCLMAPQQGVGVQYLVV